MLLLLGHAASEPAGKAPGKPGMEIAVAFGRSGDARDEHAPMPAALAIPVLAPSPVQEPTVVDDEPAPAEPSVAPSVEPQAAPTRPPPEPEIVLLPDEPPPPQVVAMQPPLQPAQPQLAQSQPAPTPPKPTRVAQKKPAPKPRAAATQAPTPAVAQPMPTPSTAPEQVAAAAPVGLPDAASNAAESIAPPAAEPSVGAAAAAGRAAASLGDVGPLALLDPAYREPPTPPVYPPRSVLLGEQGQVIVRAAIDPRGTPEEVTVWTSSGHPLLDKAAVDAVKRWRFVPARRGGATVAAWVQVPVNFKLR
ncbi:MAG: TonB family protein [Alphaproteobacteria bacterium]|nr:TonB family protein [Alphaproteobacteria bacterium]